MITLIEARTLQGTLLSLPMDDISGGYSVQKITGLDPVKATIVSSPFANSDGEQPQSSRREKRNIVLSLGIETDSITNSVRSLRKGLYDFFKPKSWASLRFYDDEGLTVSIDGQVESFDSDLFSQDPTVDISILNFDPDFQNVSSSTFSGSTVSTSATTVVDYDGDIETGFVFTLNVNRTLGEVTVYNAGEDGVIRSLDVQASFVSGDVVKVSTVSGDKYVTLTRLGVTSSLLYAMSPQSDWIELNPGENHFRAYATGAAVPYSVAYTERYGGL